MIKIIKIKHKIKIKKIKMHEKKMRCEGVEEANRGCRK